MNESTLIRKVSLTGTGLHSGAPVNLEISPAEAGTGIVFLRTDNPHAKPLLAHVSNVTSTDLCTTIGTGDHSVATIEHLMAAFYGLGIDNAFVRVSGPEVPILDGSSREFVEQLLGAGIMNQARRSNVFVITKPFEVRQGDKFIRLEPCKDLQFRISIDFPSQVIGQQQMSWSWSREKFIALADSRTFCHIKDVEAMRQVGLARGGSLANAVVISDEGVLNPEGLRYEDEFVRHKLIDCIGDLALLGGRVRGRIVAHKSGHGLHARLLKELYQQQEQFLALESAAPSDKNENSNWKQKSTKIPATVR